ncbi:MAG TPA: bifunctional alpha,alpha-trehalose-phosphate synthase (UDP-forming)/trehalose-phosphatase [Candidatus Saccharimonadales bacterium]|jgi:trehalose 6-phosphate synthase/phosphatase
MQPFLTLVSNRLPVIVKKVDGKLEFAPSVGGLATGLSSYTTNKHTKWIGWPYIPSDDLTDADKRHITKELKKRNCYPVWLSKQQVDNFYNGYSNRILWPLFHGGKIAKGALSNQARYWRAYREVNAAFAKAVLELSEPGRLVWVHDYQLLLLPALLRAQRPNDKNGFFLHIPFPSAAKFGELDDAKELVRGMLGTDLLGLHTKSYVRNFLDTAAMLDLGVVTQKEVVFADRAVRVADFPMGIDYAKYAGTIKSLEIRRELIKLRAKYRSRKLILTVDRLDPAKGLVERAAAYQEFLRQNPRLHGKVVLAMLVVPSRTDISEYQQLKDQLEKLVKEINKEFGTHTWKPIDYMYKSLPPEHVIPLYRRADVAFIAPLRDGMNLVAKEYLASQSQRHGVLILSQTAGAADELKDAVIVDPTDPDSLVRGLSRAVAISKTSWQERIKKMRKHIKTSTVQEWAGDFMDSLHAPITTLPNRTRALTHQRQQEIVESFRNAKHRLLLLDYDGSLVPIAERPEDAVPPKELKKLLRKLAKLPHTEVVVISGRTQADLTKWFDRLPIGLAAEHGAFYRFAGADNWHRIGGVTHAWKDSLIPLLEKYAAKTKGSFVEIKDSALVWHYRLSKPVLAQKNLVLLRARVAPLAERYGLRVHTGKKILEIRNAGIDKGATAKRWLSHDPDFILATGDDYTDEDTFRALPQNAHTIKIGPGRTTARLRAPDVVAVLELLSAL